MRLEGEIKKVMMITGWLGLESITQEDKLFVYLLIYAVLKISPKRFFNNSCLLYCTRLILLFFLELNNKTKEQTNSISDSGINY